MTIYFCFHVRTSNIAHQGEVSAPKPVDISSIPRIHMEEGENLLPPGQTCGHQFNPRDSHEEGKNLLPHEDHCQI